MNTYEIFSKTWHLVLKLWTPIGSLAATCIWVGLPEQKSALDSLGQFIGFLGFGQETQDGLASAQQWLTERSVFLSAAAGAIIGLAILAFIVYGSTTTILAAPAAPTLVMGFVLTQQVGTSQWWWMLMLGLPMVLGILWLQSQDASDRDGLEIVGYRLVVGAIDVLLLPLAVPFQLFFALCVSPKERS